MWYDILVLGVLVYSMARGASRGFIFQLATMAGIILCLMFAETFSGIVGPHISLQPPYNEWVTMFGAYLFFSFIAFGAARMLTKGIEEAGLKEYNSHLGAVFGLAKGVVVCLVLTFFLATLDATHNVIATSKSGYYAAVTMQKIHPIMPEKLHDALNRYIHSLDNIPGITPIPEDHVVNPNVGLVDAIKDAAKAVDEKLPNPFLTAPAAPPQSIPSNDPWGMQPRPNTTASQPGQTNVVSSIPGGARGPVQPYQPQQPSYGYPQPGGYQQPASGYQQYGQGYQQPVQSYPQPVQPSPQQPATSYPQPIQPQGTSDADFWSQVRGALGTQARQVLSDTLQNMDPATRQQLQQQILNSLKNTRSEDLPRLEQQLMRTSAGTLPGLLSQRTGIGSTGGLTAPAAATTTSTSEREQLLTEVTQLRSNLPQIQSRLQSELRGLMSGVPDTVAVAVLKDWKADLMRDFNNDPDRTTDVNTPVEQRILEQMQRYGVQFESLDPVLRDRLSSGANGGGLLR